MLNSKLPTGGVLWKRYVLENFANFTGKHVCWTFFSIKLQAWLYLKKTLTHVYCFEICEVFKNIYFEKHLLSTASICGFKDPVPAGSYTLVARTWKNFEQNKFWWCRLMQKQYIAVQKINSTFWIYNFYLQFYIQHNKTVFFNTIGIHIAILEKLSCVDEEPLAFEQLTLSHYKMQSCTALETFNNFSIIM